MSFPLASDYELQPDDLVGLLNIAVLPYVERRATRARNRRSAPAG
jgi:hypothetical protein